MAILGKVDKFNIGKRRMATVCGTVDTFFMQITMTMLKRKGPYCCLSLALWRCTNCLEIYVLALARKLTTNWPWHYQHITVCNSLKNSAIQSFLIISITLITVDKNGFMVTSLSLWDHYPTQLSWMMVGYSNII